MQFTQLHSRFDDLQQKFGEPSLDPIYGAGCTDSPKLCLVFMNPTARNVSCSKDWNGLKAPWIGTKHVWKFLAKVELFPKCLKNVIYNMTSDDWTEDFAHEVYSAVADREIYITNLAKCTQLDARHLSNSVFYNYSDLMNQEISLLNPENIVVFGNQVSSVFLNRSISVSKVRKKLFQKKINGKGYDVYSVYYPVGQGMRNIDKSIEDLNWIIKKA